MLASRRHLIARRLQYLGFHVAWLNVEYMKKFCIKKFRKFCSKNSNF